MPKNKTTAFHFVASCGIVALIILCIAYPFLPGEYDSLALPLSLIAQVAGIVGLLFVPVGILWFLKPIHAYTLSIVTTIIVLLVAIILSMVALGTVGVSFLLITSTCFGYIAWKLLSRLKFIRHALPEYQSSVPLYLVLIPTIVVFGQILLAGPLTEWSRNRAIANSAEFVQEIEAYHAEYGRYPESLLAQHKDYYPDVVGVEKYHYSAQGNAYNLFFEQPKFFFDRFGTREWVVYNPRDEHRMYSHTAWHMLLTSEEQERGQGWYESGDTGKPHWKYFWFD